MSIDPETEEFKVTEDYPGFVVHDGRAWGAITLGHTRLGLWAVIRTLVAEGYTATAEQYEMPNKPAESAIGREWLVGATLYPGPSVVLSRCLASLIRCLL